MNAVNKNRSVFSRGRFPGAAVFLALSVLFFPPPPSFAAITQTINYQGFLLSRLTNLPVETPQDIKFVIHSAAAGDAALFTESRCNVVVTKGRYDVEIGSASGGIPDSVFLNNQNLWLEIQLDGDGDCSGYYEAMSPRVRLQASPYAFNSLFASTAAAATPVFSADIIGALPQTANGAITVSTNLFVHGGLSVGSVTPGQKLYVAGMVESSSGGFKFPDGSVQLKAAIFNTWGTSGSNLYTLNAGNTGIGETLTSPQARLHISSAAGETGDLLLVSTGTSKLFRVNGLGQVYAGSYYGNGTTLTGVVNKAGDVMTGLLTVPNLTATSSQGLTAPKLKLLDRVEISSAPAAFYGGIMISTHIYLSGAAKFYGDAGGLYNITNTTDSTKVLKTGDIMTGPLEVTTLTVSGNAFSVSGSAFSVKDGNISVGSPSYLARFTVEGGIIATSSVTALGGLYADDISGKRGDFTESVTASSGTFWGSGLSQYSIETASGIWVKAGVVAAPAFVGNGALLTDIISSDPDRVLKTGDTMTGNLQILGSSLTVVYENSHPYALTVANAASPENYSLAVTTAGNVGVQILNPAAPLEVKRQILVSNLDGPAQLHLNSNIGDSYMRWSDFYFTGNPDQGVLGYSGASRDFVYRAMGSNPSTGGAEVFRISIPQADDAGSWQFGIGTAAPEARFHVASSMLVGASYAAPVLYVSTGGTVSINTNAQTHALTVNGGMNAISSITAQGGFYGNGSGITNLSADALPPDLSAASAQFGSGVNKSTFTAEGFWLPRAMTTAEMQAASPPAAGAVVFNSEINDLCISTGTAAGQWALAGSKGLGDCY